MYCGTCHWCRRGEVIRCPMLGALGLHADGGLAELSSAVVSDILDDLGHRDHVLDPAIHPLGDGAVIAGWANPFLVTEVDEIPAEPYTGEIAALDALTAGSTLRNAYDRFGVL